MKNVKSCEDLDVWKLAVELTVNIYTNLKNLKDYGLRNQMQRSAVSVPSNIAEGFERQTNKEFIQFLYIAKGSCSELRTQLHIISKLEYLAEDICTQLINQTLSISKMLYTLIQYRKNFERS